VNPPEITVDPEQYLCEVHNWDLTPLVKDRLGYGIHTWGLRSVALDPVNEPKPKPVTNKPFTVIVQCPGPKGTTDKAHPKEFHGTYSET
jgi:hypothetical protein